MASFDYKKEYKEFYLPPKQPHIIKIPPINFIAIRGQGNPNEEGGAYKAAILKLYAIAYTIKMSRLGDHKMDGYFDYVVPPLESLWRQEGRTEIDLTRKDLFSWISLIRLPEFVTHSEFEWAVGEASRKKQMDLSKAEFFTYTEGICVQCMHIGPYDDEPVTIASMSQFAEESGYCLDLSGARPHHEIYLSDVRKCSPKNLRTVIRQPITLK